MSDEFVIDSSILITAHRSRYPFDIAGSFWDQFEEVLHEGRAVIIDVVKDEIVKNEDKLANWLLNIDGIDFKSTKFITPEYSSILTYIVESGFFKEAYVKEWMLKETADPWIIAYAMVNNCSIVTEEIPISILSTKNPAKVKIPNIAEHFGVRCINLVDFMRQTGFKL